MVRSNCYIAMLLSPSMDSDKRNYETIDDELYKIIRRTREMEYRLARILYDYGPSEENTDSEN